MLFFFFGFFFVIFYYALLVGDYFSQQGFGVVFTQARSIWKNRLMTYSSEPKRESFATSALCTDLISYKTFVKLWFAFELFDVHCDHYVNDLLSGWTKKK